VNVLFTLVAVAYVDRLGRRPLLLTGLASMTVCLVAIALCFRGLAHITINSSSPVNRPSDQGVIMLAAMIIYVGSFAFSLGPVVWTVINEIYPSAVRGRGVAIATAANWGAAWVVTQFFLTLVGWIGESGTFGLFAVMCVVALAFIWFRLPETKGRSLAQIQQMWLDRAPQDAAHPASDA
jgi:MFS transporter, SP family, galactose:H+ symporter